jgi:hypothetical protein
MESKDIIIILTITVLIVAGVIITKDYVLDTILTGVNPEPTMKTIETKSFKFNTSLDDNWTFYKDHDDGYSYKNDAINQSKIRYYTGAISDVFTQAEYVGWKPLHPDNLSEDIYLYESHFDNEVPVGESYHNYYSAFLELKNGGYVHVSSMDLNRTLTIVKAIDDANN